MCSCKRNVHIRGVLVSGVDCTKVDYRATLVSERNHQFTMAFKRKQTSLEDKLNLIEKCQSKESIRAFLTDMEFRDQQCRNG